MSVKVTPYGIVFLGIDKVIKYYQPGLFGQRNSYTYQVAIVQALIELCQEYSRKVRIVPLVQLSHHPLDWCNESSLRTNLSNLLHVDAKSLKLGVNKTPRCLTIINWMNNHNIPLKMGLIVDVKDPYYLDQNVRNFYPPAWCLPDYGLQYPQMVQIHRFLKQLP